MCNGKRRERRKRVIRILKQKNENIYYKINKKGK
jgi:hypothetical protein